MERKNKKFGNGDPILVIQKFFDFVEDNPSLRTGVVIGYNEGGLVMVCLSNEPDQTRYQLFTEDELVINKS